QLLGRFIDVCNAVEYAHSRGVLHRDLKPGNIMVGKYGETLVVDWGLAKTVGSSETASRSEETSLRPLSALSSSGHTQPGSAVGTPAYMSPEQAAGNLDVLGPASDVYSLGATLYHVLTGVPPFERQDVAAVLRKVQTGEIRKPRAVQREIPAALEAICLKAMALAPSDRYATPRLMADDLEHWLADEPVAAAPERIGERLSRIGRRHRGAVRAGAAALILIALVAIVAALLINSARHDALDLASKNENLALEKGQLAEEKGKLAEENAALAREEGEARAAEAEQAALARKRARELRHSLYLSDINRVEQYARIPNVERMRALLARHIPNENEEDLRGFDWSYWWNFIHGDRLCLEGDEPVQKVAASPDGRTIAIACPGGRLHLVDSHTGQRRRLVLTLPAENCAALRFTGDGKQLVAVGAKGAFKAWNAETGQVIRDQHAQSPPEKQAREQCSRWPAAISADGRTILARHPNQEVPVMGKWSGPSCLYLADLSTGLYIGTSVPPGQKSRETDPLAGAMLRFTDRSRMPRQPNLLNVGSALGELPPMATIDPTGSRYWPSAKDASAPPVEEWGAPVFSLALSPSGKWFADGGRDGLVCLWNSETLAPERTLAAHEGIVWDLTFSGDERYLASAGTDGLVVVWDTSSGQPVARCRGSDRPVRSVVFLPGDRRVAAAGDDGVLRIWDARSGRPLRDLYGHTARIHSLAVAADETGHDIRLVSGGADGTVRVWAVDGPPDVLMPRDSSILTNALAPPQARWLAAVDAWGSIHVWDSETGTHRALLTPPLNSLFGSPIPNAVISAADDGSRLAVNYLGSLVVWDVDARKKALQIDGMRIQVPGELPRNVSSLPPNLQFQCIALSRDGKLLAAGCSDGAIRFWNVETREVVRSWSYSSEQNQSGAPIAAIKFLPDQSGMVVVRGGAPSEVRVRRFLDDADRLILASPRIEGIAVSRDGSQIASVGSEGLQVVDIESGSVIARPVDAGDKLRFVDFSPDGRMLVILGTKNDVRLWDLARGAETRRWNADLPIVAAFIDDGRRLALATQKGIIELWQPGDDRPVERLQAPAGPLYSADLSADGQWLAAAVRLRAGPFGRKLQSDTIVLLDIAGGNQSMVATYLDEARPFVAFLPDDRGLVSNLGVHLWRGQRRSLEGAQWTPLGAFPPNKSGSHPTVPLAAVSGDGSRLAV
ncbi:MAG: protein kinase domain-containing protein, partial [Deltaproteobacteria bacterium]